ncbi:hypothetical protein ABEB36_007565 [Hypothenemus hampei]|uniref:Deacetylase sirtuin-type domain-containing protein n=1 Tax=Hypothenemus hampei TaxID=57062 RepID=A0ABD1EXJ1_HYPHA
MTKHILQVILNSPFNTFTKNVHQFVPKHNPVHERDVKFLEEFLCNAQKLLVVTGAGISTESGIPDYRSAEVGLYSRTNHKPIQHIEFINSATTRQRYWARNFVGWFRFSKSEPNFIHYWLKDLEIKEKKLRCIVTQNVDGLHFKAGSKNLIELHGTGYRVICLDCSASYDRHSIQKKLLEKHKINFEEMTKMIRPDGDVEIPMDFIANFVPPTCESCGGVLKPDITFFGDNVPKNRVALVRSQVLSSDSILVLGSTLSVFSGKSFQKNYYDTNYNIFCILGYRIILQAVEETKPICLVNIGPTRADKLVKLKIEAKCGDILSKLRNI